MKYLNQDIFNDLESRTVILHGCNCFHTMGAGIAKCISDRHAEVMEADLRTGYGDRSKLGSCSRAIISSNLHIINCYTQFGYGTSKRHVDYKAVSDCLERVSEVYDNTCIIRMPMIGCGLAGGDWEIIGEYVESIFDNYNVTIYYL